MAISGFTFGHNLIESGYPIIEAIETVREWVDEVVFVDMESTDSTREVALRLGCRVLEGQWGNRAGETLKAAHAMHCLCANDVIIHFEADEVFDPKLIHEIIYNIDQGYHNLNVWRVQVEQNFQRVRWYPEPVHRVFRKGTVKKEGHTTDLAYQRSIKTISEEYGYLWDCTNCFRGNWWRRVLRQAELWHEPPKLRYVPLHFKEPTELDEDDVHHFLNEAHWVKKESFLALPDMLVGLLGLVEYTQSKTYQRLMTDEN